MSKNWKDYWDGDKDRIHPALKPEIEDATVQLQFFGSLVSALPQVGI